MKVFDYMFYRISRKFYRGDGNLAIRGLLIVSLVQTFSIYDIGLIIIHLLTILKLWTFQQFVALSIFETISGPNLTVIVMAIILALNWMKYKNRFHQFESKWEFETKTHFLMRGWLVLIGCLSPFILLLVLLKAL